MPTEERVGIRAATADDCPEIADIFGHYAVSSVATFEENALSVPEWKEKFAGITGRGLPFLVAETGGGVVGYAYAGAWRPKPAYRHTVEDSIFLDPGWTGRGLGGRLLAELLTCSTRAGAAQMIAVIADSGDGPSATLHRRLGFTDAGRLAAVGFKHGRWIDTFLLQRDLATWPETA
jgi:phosphinothricin acetyltransferase